MYPRSFADADGDGTGDVRGIIDRLPYLAELGVDAIWISPWYPSPLLDGGYDVADYRDINPDFGSLADADELIAKAHEAGIRVIIDLVPNHSSWDHPAFRAALADPAAPERDLYIFRDGRGPNGDEPPNNWPAVFGGPAWERTTNPDGTPGQWYLHLFDISQPDWNWDNDAVADEFDSILRFWFDRGIDGFRIDVADSMAKDLEQLPDVPVDSVTQQPTHEKFVGSPIWDHPGVERIHKRWRAIADSYADTEMGGRIFVSEAYLTPAERLVRYVVPERLHTTFNFDALLAEWSAETQRNVINTTIAAHTAVGAPCTWVLANHDNQRVATRYGKTRTGAAFAADGSMLGETARPNMITNDDATDLELGRRRSRAAALLELALPGGAYIYQGDELGLPEVEDLPTEALQDPVWERSGHIQRGRDGCRVPLPWSGAEPPFGFGPGDAQPWLPQPADWQRFSVETEDTDPASELNLYRAALAERRRNPALGDGTLIWDEGVPDDVLSFTREPGFRCVVNFGAQAYPLPDGARVLVHSGDAGSGVVGTDEAVWLAV
ncbi:glycoside hydrolase family 13 protein [Naumannella cuiyingiana]|uniref:glycoside hydrolase family 13 protein n=1 Tax=Naumannella cuiyingiana TaxID=1347891 RepID=UPI0031B6403D